MSHLKLKKQKSGKYKIFNEETGKFVGKAMKDKKKAEKVTNERDKKEDKE